MFPPEERILIENINQFFTETINKLDKIISNNKTDIIIIYEEGHNNNNSNDKERYLRQLYNLIIKNEPNLTQTKSLPVIKTLTYENFKKLIYNKELRTKFLNELGFKNIDTILNERTQQQLIKRILTGKLSFKEGALLLSNEFLNFIKQIFIRKNKKEIIKTLSIGLILTVILILIISFLFHIAIPTLLTLIGINVNSTIGNMITMGISSIVFSVLMALISKVYMFIHSKMGTTIYGYVGLLSSVVGSLILFKVSTLVALIMFLIVFLIWIIWELEILLLSKIEVVYQKLNMSNARRRYVEKSLMFNIYIRFILYLLDKLGKFINTKNIKDAFISLIIKTEDSIDSIVSKIMRIFDELYLNIRRVIKDLLLNNNKKESGNKQ